MTAAPERIVVTGVGLVSALGRTAQRTFERLLAGDCGFGPIQLFDGSGQRTDVVAEVRGLDLSEVACGQDAQSWSRSDAMAMLAAREAIADGRLRPRDRLGIIVGASTGGMYEAESAFGTLTRGVAGEVSMRRLLAYPLSTTVRRIAEAVGEVERSATVCSACSSGAVAIVQAATWLELGYVERVLAGGVDGLSLLTLTGFNALGATSLEACRPFDARRSGLTLGEGAGFLLLETEASARRRGARVLARLTGWAVAAEAYHLTHPEPSGATAVSLLRGAMRRAGLSNGQVDYINAHGTGTIHNDAMESSALREAFGDAIERVYVSSSKGQLGHTLGAAGAIEAVVTALAVHRGAVPPTGGLEEPDPAGPLRHVFRKGKAVPIRSALSSSFGFGGTGCVLAFESASSPDQRPQRDSRQVVVTAAAAIVPDGLRGGAPLASLLEGRAPSPQHGASTDYQPLDSLDAGRSRRFDRASAFVTVGVEALLRHAEQLGRGVGLAAGTAYGTVSRSLEFLERVSVRGPRFANPAEFPHLLPSAPSGNASIYLGLTGPVISVLEMDTSAESALAMACDWVRSGLVDVAAGGSAEPHDDFVSKVLAPLHGPSVGPARSEGAAWLLAESEQAAALRGATILARLVHQGQCLPTAEGPLGQLFAPRDAAHALVVLSGDEQRGRRLLDASRWSEVRTSCVASDSGGHEGMGGIALAAAVTLLAQRSVDEVLVLSSGLQQVHWSLFVGARLPQPKAGGS